MYVRIRSIVAFKIGARGLQKKTRQLCLQPHEKFHAFLATRMDGVALVAIQHLLEYIYVLPNKYKTMNYGYTTEYIKLASIRLLYAKR